MKYPFWLPKPRRHWLRAIELGFASIPVGFIFFAAIKLGFFLFPPLMLLLLFVPPFLFAHIYQYFHDEPSPNLPIWFPRLRCWANGVAYTIILIISSLITVFIWVDMSSYPTPNPEEIEDKVVALNVTWVIIAAYLFYLKDGIKWVCQELVKLAFALVGKKR